MTRIRLTLALTICSFGGSALAQQLDLPHPSPLGKVSQVVGLTEIGVEWSSPAVKGRKIWGELLKYDELWRTGANVATKVTFSKDVTIDGKPVPAGSYSIFTIPGKTTWTVILNKNFNQAGTQNYKQDLDVLRLTVTPEVIPNRERLAFLITDFNDDSAKIEMEWEKLRVSIPVKLGTDAQATANIKAATDNAWRPFNASARYLMDTKKDLDGALPLVEKSLSLKEDWQNVWTKAQILAGKKRFKEALVLATKANDLGAKAEQFFSAADVKKALVDWKGK